MHGLGENPFEIDESEVEQPGSDYCPLIGAELTAAAHLLLALVDTEVNRLGGRAVYDDTDSAFVTPSRIAGEVSATLAGLNPYSESVPFLKDETENKAPKGECPKDCLDRAPRFFGLSAKRYCLFVRGKGGHPHVFHTGKSLGASDHGLGSFQVGKDRKDWIAQLWERIIENGAGAADDYAGIPATSEFSLSTPNLLPRVRSLGMIRPFTFLTARLLEPGGSDEMRSELVAYVDSKDTAGQSALMAMPRQRSWGRFLRISSSTATGSTPSIQTDGRFGGTFLSEGRTWWGSGRRRTESRTPGCSGLRAASGRAKRYVDPDPFKGSATEVARRLGVSRRTVFYLRRRLARRRNGDRETTVHGHATASKGT